MNNTIIKLNLGCGGRPLKDYINIDMDVISIDEFQWKGDRDHMHRLMAKKK